MPQSTVTSYHPIPPAVTVGEFFSDGTLTLVVVGEIDHHSAKALRENMDDAIIRYRAKKVALDLSAVDFMDSSGLGLILGRYTKAREIGGILTVSGASPRSAKILRMAGVDKIISIEEK